MRIKNIFFKKHFLYIFNFLSASLLFFLLNCNNNQIPDYKNPNLPIEKRIDDLLGRMTLEEKFWQLYMIPGDLSDGKEKYINGVFGFQVASLGKSSNANEQILNYGAGEQAKDVAKQINEIQKFFVEETRLGIPIIPFDEALHGLVRTDATAFPQSIALAATWDTTLMGEIAHAIAIETKTRGIRQILSPVLNIANDVRWGRTEETYGEDPFLTTQMAISFLSSIEKLGIITTPKHFIANVGDGGRDSYPIHFSERLMEEVFFPPFKAAIQIANSGSIMTAYNSYNGSPCSANDWLLNQKLKKEWGFKGFVISDAGATGGANVLHFTTKDYSESTKESIENGLDVIFQTSYNHYTLFYEAFKNGMVNQKAMDEAVRRVLRAKFKLGLFENPYVNIELAEKWNGCENHKLLAKKAALESIVLLKNENKILPLNANIKSIAVIGIDATEARLGGYSGPGNNPISILNGLKNYCNNSIQIQYAQGCGRNSEEFKVVPSSNLFHLENGINKLGLNAKYFNNINLSGKAILERIDPQIDFNWTLFSPENEVVNYDFYSAFWTGKIVSSETGKFKIGLNGNDGYRLYINNKMVIDNWKKQSYSLKTTDFYFENGKEYEIRIEFYETVGNVKLQLIWNQGIDNNWKRKIDEAVLTAQNCEVSIVAVGIEEGEFRDRASLKLPGHQEELITRIASLGKPMVVILVGGSAITMNNWIGAVPAILDVWYPGEQGGNAIAEVLFGKFSPSGRLPITFPLDEAQLPLGYYHKPTGRGDDYLDLTGKALFPFGYGLSYTQFEYSNLKIIKPIINSTETAFVEFSIKNIGDFDGDEVVQLYIKDLFSSLARPIMELKGFNRIHLKSGETKKIVFKITPELLKMLDKNMVWKVEPGDFRIMVGASSNDIRLRGILTVK